MNNTRMVRRVPSREIANAAMEPVGPTITSDQGDPEARSSISPKPRTRLRPASPFFPTDDIPELEGFSDAARRGLRGVRAQLRANLIPPIWRELRNYDRQKLRADFVAGLTVAVLTLPQAVGFAIIAGLPVQAVLVTTIIGASVCACFSSSRHLIFGPTNTISIILAGAVLMLSDVPLTPLEKVMILGFLIGCIQLTAGLLRIGQLTQFVSRTVIIAYTTAVAVLIASSQLGNLLGVSRGGDLSLPGTVTHLLTSLATLNFNYASACVGLGSVTFLVTIRRWRPHWPDGLLLLVLATTLSALLPAGRFGLTVLGNLGDVAVQAPLFVGLPLNLEALKLVPRVSSAAIAIAVLGMLEAVSIAKNLATRSGQQIDANQELIGMGLGNLAATAFGAMPGSASFLRSATNLQAGGRTQLAAIYSAIALIGVLVIVPLLNFAPVAALAAYLIVIAARLFNRQQISIARRSTRADAAVFWVTLISALFLQLDTAIYVGVGISLILFLQKAATPVLVEYAFNDAGHLAELPDRKRRNNPQVSIVHVEGDLFFGAADLLQDEVRKISQDPQTRVVILRLKNARHLDASTVLSLLQLHTFLHSGGRHLLLSGVGPEVYRILSDSGALPIIGTENLFPSEENPTLSTKHALQRAKQLLDGASADVRLFYSKQPQTRA